MIKEQSPISSECSFDEYLLLQQRLMLLKYEDRGNNFLVGKTQESDGHDVYTKFVRERVKDPKYCEILVVSAVQSFPFLLSRVRYHLIRLLSYTRSEEEQVFAKAFINQCLQYDSVNKRDRRIEVALGSESRNVTIWWTIAPYAFKGLVQAGQTPSRAIEALFKWMYRAQPTEPTDEFVTLPRVDWMGRTQQFVLQEYVQNVDGIPKVKRFGIVEEINGEHITVIDDQTGLITSTTLSQVRLAEPTNTSELKEGTRVLLLENGELPISPSHQLASDIAIQLVVPYLLQVS